MICSARKTAVLFEVRRNPETKDVSPRITQIRSLRLVGNRLLSVSALVIAFKSRRRIFIDHFCERGHRFYIRRGHIKTKDRWITYYKKKINKKKGKEADISFLSTGFSCQASAETIKRKVDALLCSARL